MFTITFNWTKHHLRECQHFLKKIKYSELDKKPGLESITSIGNHVFDLYTGKLDLLEIEIQMNRSLLIAGVENKKSYIQWLGKAGYKTLTLTDGSKWIL